MVQEVRRTTPTRSANSVFLQLVQTEAWKEVTIDQVRRAVSASNAEQGTAPSKMSTAKVLCSNAPATSSSSLYFQTTTQQKLKVGAAGATPTPMPSTMWAPSIILKVDQGAGFPTVSESHLGSGLEKASPLVGATPCLGMNTCNTNSRMTSPGLMSTSKCWGAQMTGTNKNCSGRFVAGPYDFKNKFCEKCNEQGINVPTSWVRALLPDRDLPSEQKFINRKGSQLLTTYYLLATTYYLLLTTYYLRLTTYYLLLTTYY